MAADPRNIRVLALDVDGVLTDGSIMIDDLGHETKRFNVRDGLGLTTWVRLGLEVAIVTRRSGKALEHRMRELGVTRVVQGCQDKGAAIDALCRELGVGPAEVAYIGDDWPDLCAMRKAGYPIAVGDADPRVKAVAAHVTLLGGGMGAVREAVEHLLNAKGLMGRALEAWGEADDRGN